MTTRLEGKLRSGDFVVTTELTPPKGIDLTETFAKAQLLASCVDAMNITESPRARMAIEPKSVAHLLIDRGVEPIVQVTARDRNRIAIQADLLGACALGVGNFVFMTGDQPKNGDHPDAKPVFDLSTIELLQAARALAGGHDLAGNELKGTPHLYCGATANPGAPDFDGEVANARRKIDAGARFLQTQAVFEVSRIVRYLAAGNLGEVGLLAGIIPLKSAKMAGWLNANVPGVRVPEELLEEMQAAASAGREEEVGLDIAVRLIRGLKGQCAGVHIMALGWEAHIPRMLRDAGIRG
ncbi:MAG TPA: methylenetetrahydrofolate reductase [Steroidobacteraceae bacterium]|nr:methylenetetrahydrofolate reductase [Steroidobacteraceae bacterium]